jgi:hypothetical protein
MAKRFIYFPIMSLSLLIILFKILLIGKPGEQGWFTYLMPMGFLIIFVFLIVILTLGFVYYKKQKR